MTITREGILQLEFALLVIYGIIMITKKVKLNKLLFNLSFGLYISIIIAICFFPIRIGAVGLYDSMINNFIPFKSIIGCFKDSIQNHTHYGILSVLWNFIMLMPLGLFFQYYIKDLKSRLVGITLFSISIETIQFIIGLLIGYNYRCIDIDDVILNVFGGVISCVLFNFIILKYTQKMEKNTLE